MSAKEKKYVFLPIYHCWPKIRRNVVRRANFPAGSFELPAGPDHIGVIQSYTFEKPVKSKSSKLSTDKIITDVQRFCLGILEMRIENNKISELNFFLISKLGAQSEEIEGRGREEFK